jgi:signal-transduction protein with cAMP-binding, CBS, and nucleotidyltransferase domain
MTREPITTGPDTTLLECAKKIVKNKTGSLLLVQKNKLLGIISEKDILWALVKTSSPDLSKIKAIDISPRKIATIKPSATIKEAFEKMKKLKFERLPVILDKELVGLITVKDILNFHPEFYPELEELAEIREESRKLKMVEKIKGETNKREIEGVCDECGNYGILKSSKGMMVCESCFED